MGMATKNVIVLAPKLPSFMNGVRMMRAGGKAGGSIQESGGKMAEMGAAREDEYFRKLQAQQLESLKSHVDEKSSTINTRLIITFRKLRGTNSNLHSWKKLRKSDYWTYLEAGQY